MSAEAGPSPLQKLVEAFHSLLDEPLIVAIATDHDLRNAPEYKTVYTILQGLAETVLSEEATGFNPSGTHGFIDVEGDRVKGSGAATAPSLSEHTSQAHNTETSSTSQTSLSAESVNDIPRLLCFDNDSEESKILQLRGLFPDLKEYDIIFSFKKAKGDFQTILDDLLNVQYLQSTGQQVKGIDGFFYPDGPTALRKKTKKGKRPVDRGSCMTHNRSTSSSHMKEFKDPSEIAHVAERFNVSHDEVSAMYYEKDRSSSATVVGILKQHISQKNIIHLDETGKSIVEGLSRKYRNVPGEYLQVIVQATGLMSQFSDDLAALASKHFSKRPRTQRLDMDYRLTPLPDEDIEGLQAIAAGKGSLLVIDQDSSQISMASPNTFSHHSQAIQMSENLTQARRDAAASAERIHRRGASNSLYRQAASYYAETAREQARYAREAMSNAADLLVEKQSTKETIDLHGVSVHDGVRIARQKALDWWQSNRELRGKHLQDHGLTIITGLGRHSAGGVSQLRRAVAAALLQDGWKLRVETGMFYITGR